MSSFRSESPGSSIVETIKEILAEPVGVDQGLEVLVRGGDQSDIDLDCACSADRFEGPCLENPQQLDLGLQGDISNFVKEQGAAVGQFETSYAVAMGTGECSFDVSEQFTFQQAGAEGGAVYPHKRAIPS